MSAKDKFNSLGFSYVTETDVGIEYTNRDYNEGLVGLRSIFIDKETGGVLAEEGSEFEYFNLPFELSPALLVAIMTQLDELGIS